MQKLCIISVISDVYTDQRVLRTVEALKELNYECKVIGRKTGKTQKFKGNFDFTLNHLNPFFKKGVGMYVMFNVLLFFRLLNYALQFKKNRMLLYVNDLDTLLPNYIISKLFGLPIVYDSHELFTEVPELQNRKFKKKIWEIVEKSIVPKLPFAITVNDSIAEWYNKKYRVPFFVVRNISKIPVDSPIKSRSELGLPEDKFIIILQGTGINVQRGAEELVEAMQYLDTSYLLLIIGGGDVIEKLKRMVEELKLKEKVWIKNRMPADDLYHYTYNASIGVSIDKPNNLNYLYSLPNKIFSYIHAHIPILASRLPEIEKIILKYNIGAFIENHNPQHIAMRIKEMMYSDQYPIWKQNTFVAAEELCWKKEKEVLKTILRKYINP
ncbi:MAG: glycosyltransferase [Bacteroidia bacterium]|nr:MAG: glycosyltransferase [Bacteroidia bacterium]